MPSLSVYINKKILSDKETVFILFKSQLNILKQLVVYLLFNALFAVVWKTRITRSFPYFIYAIYDRLLYIILVLNRVEFGLFLH